MFRQFVALGIVAGSLACSADRDMKDMKRSTNEMQQTTEEMKTSTDHVAQTSDKMSGTTERMANTTDEMNGKTTTMVETTKDMNATTKDMNATTKEMAATTKEMSEETKALSAKTNEMADTTADMAKTTEEMAELTRVMAETTKDLAAVTKKMAETTEAQTAGMKRVMDNMYYDLRQGDSLQIRKNSLKALKETKDQIAKFSAAAHYFMAFEFQLWKGTDSDTEEKLEQMRIDAVDEFLRDVHEFLPDNRSVSPLSKDGDTQSLYALVAAIHMVNSNATAAAKEGAGGMLELLRRGISSKAALEKGDKTMTDIPQSELHVLQFERDVEYLLNLRVNFMPAMIVQDLASEGGSNIGKFKQLWMWLFPWKAKSDARNVAQIEMLADVMVEANETIAIMRSAGMTPKINGQVRKVLKNLRISVDGGSLNSTTRSEATGRLKRLIDEFLSNV